MESARVTSGEFSNSMDNDNKISNNNMLACLAGSIQVGPSSLEMTNLYHRQTDPFLLRATCKLCMIRMKKHK